MKYIGVKNSTSHLAIIKARVEMHVKSTALDLSTDNGMIGLLENRDSTRTKKAAVAIAMTIGMIWTFGEDRPYRKSTIVVI